MTDPREDHDDTAQGIDQGERPDLPQIEPEPPEDEE